MLAFDEDGPESEDLGCSRDFTFGLSLIHSECWSEDHELVDDDLLAVLGDGDIAAKGVRDNGRAGAEVAADPGHKTEIVPRVFFGGPVGVSVAPEPRDLVFGGCLSVEDFTDDARDWDEGCDFVDNGHREGVNDSDHSSTFQ